MNCFLKSAVPAALLTLGGVGYSADAAPSMAVVDALQRPALMARQPERAVLLGIARAGERLVAVGERGIVLVSDDDGARWRQVPTPVSVTLTAIRFGSARYGVAVGHGGTVLVTRDAGDTWTRQLEGRQLAQKAMVAAQASADAGALRDAEQLVADGPDKPILDALQLDAKRTLVVGAYGIAFFSEDEGQSWAPWMARLDNPKGLHLYSLRARGGQIVIVGEQGLVLRSDDGGRQFHRITTPYQGSFFTLELPADNEIVLAGLRGNVWRSVDSGRSWVQVATPAPVSITASALQADGRVRLVTQAGGVLALNGDTLAALPLASTVPLSGFVTRRDGSVLAVGPRGIVALGAKP